MTVGTVESPLRCEAHGGFGERLGETGREQSRYRAPGLLSDNCTVVVGFWLTYDSILDGVWLIHARTGSFGATGRPPRNRSGNSL